MDHVKRRINERMRSLGVNQDKLAELANVSQSTIHRILKSPTRNRIDTLKKIAKVLEVPLEYLTIEDEKKAILCLKIIEGASQEEAGINSLKQPIAETLIPQDIREIFESKDEALIKSLMAHIQYLKSQAVLLKQQKEGIEEIQSLLQQKSTEPKPDNGPQRGKWQSQSDEPDQQTDGALDIAKGI